MRQLLLNHFEKYPLMQLQDCVKLLYQCHFGCGHFLTDPAQTLLRLQNEYETCRPIAGPLLEPVGPNYCRLYLSALDTSKLSLETLGKSFYLLLSAAVSSKAVFEADLALLGEMIRQRELPFQQSDWEAFCPITGQKAILPSATVTLTETHTTPLIRVRTKAVGITGPFLPLSIKSCGKRAAGLSP